MLKTFGSLDTSKSRLTNTNIYHATNGLYTPKSHITREAIQKSDRHSLKVIDDKLHITLDKDAPDYNEIHNVIPIPPDEILELRKPSDIKIPYVMRDEFLSKYNVPLPSPDLLTSLHYYASKKGIATRSLDETALLSLGMLVEDWIDELVDEHAASMFETDDVVGVSEVTNLVSILSDNEGDVESDIESD